MWGEISYNQKYKYTDISKSPKHELQKKFLSIGTSGIIIPQCISLYQSNSSDLVLAQSGSEVPLTRLLTHPLSPPVIQIIIYLPQFSSSICFTGLFFIVPSDLFF